MSIHKLLIESNIGYNMLKTLIDMVIHFLKDLPIKVIPNKRNFKESCALFSKHVPILQKSSKNLPIIDTSHLIIDATRGELWGLSPPKKKTTRSPTKKKYFTFGLVLRWSYI